MAASKTNLYEKAQGFMQKGLWDKALDSMYEVYMVDNTDPHITMRIGDLNKKLGLKKEAADFYFKTANLYADEGQTTKAAATYKMILRIDPTMTEVRDRLDDLAAAQESVKPLSIEPVSAPPGATDGPLTESGLFMLNQSAYPDEPDTSLGQEIDTLDKSVLEVERPARPVASSKAKPAPSTSIFDDFAADVVAPENMDPAVNNVPSSNAKKAEFLGDLEDEELWELLGRMDRLTFGPGEDIIREGDEGDSIYIISEGKVRVTVNVDNKVVLLAELGEQDFFGEVSFLTGKPRTATVTAADTTHIMELKRSEVDDLIKRYPNVEHVLDMFHKTRVADTISSINIVTMGML